MGLLCTRLMESKFATWVKSIKDATWERENTIKTNFPNFSLQDCNVLKRGICYGHDHNLFCSKLYCSILHTRIKCED